MKLSEARILLVDDEPIILEIFSIWLGAGVARNLLTAANGEAALAILATEPIDLLITDVRMPVMDGTTLVRRIAESGNSPTIIFVSGFGDVDLKEMYALGVEAFLSKPLRREDLLAALKTALADRAALWQEPMPDLPRQSLCVPIASGLTEHLPVQSLRFGRGGFCVRCPTPLSLGRIAFTCRNEKHERHLVGHGYVRWYSRAERTAGIEFTYLEPQSRSWLVEEFGLAPLRSFIPDFAADQHSRFPGQHLSQ